eukprot:2317521-Pleurochrysis_carterae.AAC.1
MQGQGAGGTEDVRRREPPPSSRSSITVSNCFKLFRSSEGAYAANESAAARMLTTHVRTMIISLWRGLLASSLYDRGVGPSCQTTDS